MLTGNMVDCYKQKKADVATWADDPSPKVREFTKRYVHALDQRIAAE